MARKNNARAEQSNICVFDTRTKAVMAQTSQDGVKEKVAAVREVITDRGKNEVILVLQYYDYDVERTIQAYVEDGAKEALQEWHYPGNKPPNKKKKKNKVKKEQKDATLNGPNTAPSADQDGKLTAAASAEKTELENDKKDSEGVHDRNILPESNDAAAAQPLPQRTSRIRGSSSQSSHQSADQSTDPATVTASHTRGHPNLQKQEERKQPARPLTLRTAGHQDNRPRSVSESSSVSASGDQTKKHHAGLQRSLKDLQRQTTSLQRLKLVLNERIDKSYQGIKSSFQQLQTEINNREVELLSDMDKVKKEALDTLAMRQQKAADLKMRTDRHMNDQELLELRADIKQFVTDRKIDEELCEAQRFVFDLNSLVQQIQTFGEVVTVNTSYSQRRPSLSSIASSHDDFMSPLSSAPTTPALPLPVTGTTFTVTDSSLTTQELAELQHRLQDSLKQQGLAVKSPPPRHASNPHPRGPGAGGRGSNTQTTNTSTSQGQDDSKKGRPARRRQKMREREREDRNNQSERRTPSPMKTQSQFESRPQRPQNNRRVDSAPKQRANGDTATSSQPGGANSKRQFSKRNSPDKMRETNGNPSFSTNRQKPDLGAGGDNVQSSSAYVNKSATQARNHSRQQDSVNTMSSETTQNHRITDALKDVESSKNQNGEVGSGGTQSTQNQSAKFVSEDSQTAQTHTTSEASKEQVQVTMKKPNKDVVVEDHHSAQNGDAVLQNGEGAALMNGVNGESQ